MPTPVLNTFIRYGTQKYVSLTHAITWYYKWQPKTNGVPGSKNALDISAILWAVMAEVPLPLPLALEADDAGLQGLTILELEAIRVLIFLVGTVILNFPPTFLPVVGTSAISASLTAAPICTTSSGTVWLVSP